MPGPHVTLAILSRNRPDDLRRALEAARGVPEPPDDVLVSDDSDDAQRPAVRALVERHPGVRYLTGPRRGLGANENHVVANLLPEAEWVVFHGDDARLSDTFVPELRRLIARHAPQRRIPAGVELQPGGLVEPRRLDFLGFQAVPHASYAAGAEIETVVVQATAFPAGDLRQVRWLEVSPYGYDEVDMAYKMRRLGWRFAFEPSLRVFHDQSPVGRDAYAAPAQVARFYVRLRSFSVYERRPLALLAYLVTAPLHLAAAHVRRGEWREAAGVPAIAVGAYGAWLRSLRRDWRQA
jgi:GT2 family glycosyltransferase